MELMNSDANIESRILRLVATFEERLRDVDVANACDLISHRECGIELELLCTQLIENDVEMSIGETAELRQLAQLARAMGIDMSAFGFPE